MNLSLDLKGTFCNSWPHLKIYINDSLLFDDFIDGYQTVNLSIADSPSYTIVIEGIKKQFGENNVWDTQVINDQIVDDKTLEIIDLRIENISMGNSWIRTLLPNFTGVFYKNETLTFIVTSPILDWIIEQKYVNAQLSAAPFSGGDRFSHQNIINRINSIKDQYFNG